MIKTNEMVKAPHTTMFFNRITVTEDEYKRMHEFGQVLPSWLKLVVINYDEFDNIRSMKRAKQSSELYNDLVVMWSANVEELKQDVRNFAIGEINLIDMVVKYGVGYKKCRNFVKDVLNSVGDNMDVDKYWKQHKKHQQKATSIVVYGVEHSALDPEVKAKRIATNMERYGADNAMKTPETQEKLRRNIREKYGVDYTFINNVDRLGWLDNLYTTLCKDERWVSILEDVASQHEVECDYNLFTEILPLNRRDFIISELSNTNVEDIIRLWNEKTGTMMEYPSNKLFDLPFMFSKPWLHYYDKMGILVVPPVYYTLRSSVYEASVKKVLDDMGLDYVLNRRKQLDGLEMDIFIPEKNVGIEINPNVSHNSNIYATDAVRSMFDSRKDKGYHFNKYKVAKDVNGITLIQLYANDLIEPVFSEITTKRLKSLLVGCTYKYYARNVELTHITSNPDKKMAREFMNQYHSQGSSRAKEYWVFTHEDDVIGVASFVVDQSTGKGANAELKRLCFKPDVQIVGGLSKLIKHYFRTHPECVQIKSYSDNNLGNGNGYAKAGATFVRETGPSLKFISPKNGLDVYSWQIATPWGASNGVIGNDAVRKGLPVPQTQAEIDEYVEKTLSHREGDGCGYDRLYTAGSKLWVFNRPTNKSK